MWALWAFEKNCSALKRFAHHWDIETFCSEPHFGEVLWSSKECLQTASMGSTSKQKNKINSQLSDACCFSHNLYSIKCPYIDVSLSAQLKPSCGANFVLVPLSIIRNGVQLTAKFLVEDSRLGAWILHHDYILTKVGKIIPCILTVNKPSLVMLSGHINIFNMALNTVVITTKLCF